MSILGNRVLRTEDPTFLTVGGTYTADLDDPRLDGAVHVTYVRSMMAHATIGSIEVGEARGAPGVLAVYTADDVASVGGIGPVPISPPMFPDTMRRPWLATGRVRFVGEPIAVVVTEKASQGEDAAELVWADLEPLEAVLDPLESLETSNLLFPEADSNVAGQFADGDFDEEFFDGCEVVTTARVVNQRLAACPLEVRSSAVTWDDGRLVSWMSTQNVHGGRDALAEVYGLEPGDVHAITPDVGGGFGPKISPYAEELLLPWISRQVGRPVRWTETRSENMVAMGHGRDQVHDVTIGGRRDGTAEAIRIDIVADCGAYPALGAFLPYFTRKMSSGVYDFDRVETRSRSVVTNKMSSVAYRGAGRPEATVTVERAMDLFAAEIGMSPVEVRRKNLIAADAFPFKTRAGATYDCGDYERSLDLALEAAGYDELRAEQERRRSDPSAKQLGIGVSVYVEITAGPSAGAEFAEVQMHHDGRVTVYTGTSPHGQGHATSWAMLASDELGVPMDKIEVIHGDTDLVAAGSGTMASRSLQLGGSAVFEAATSLVDRARDIAADLLEASPDDIVFNKGDKDAPAFHVAGTPTVSSSWPDIVAAGGSDGLLLERGEFKAPTPTYPFGSHVSVIELDAETGQVTLLRHITCDDAGRILNPMLVEGQRHGGIAQGAAQALVEAFVYDEFGNPVTSNLADYTMISAAELPMFELVSLETPTPANPLGAKGIGESGTIGATPAVQSAVHDALGAFGVRHLDMPYTPERVWTAIRESSTNPVGGGS